MNIDKKTFQIVTILFLSFLNLTILSCEQVKENTKIRTVPPVYKYILKGHIKSPQGWEKIPEFRIFYQGQQHKPQSDCSV